MGNDANINQPQSVIAGTSNNNDTNVDSPSRLLVDSNNLRNSLYTRNLYAPDTQYPAPMTDTQEVVNAISSVISVIAPFKGFSLKDSLIGRELVNPTPLTEIGLVMLGKQFAYNSMSHLAQQTFPKINLKNALKGGKLFQPNISFKITKAEGQGGFQNFLDNVVFRNVEERNPFDKHVLNSDYIKNTGTGQLSFLYDALNQNIYKQNDDTLYTYGNKIEKPINDRRNLTANRIYFNNDNPYGTIETNTTVLVSANQSMRNGYDMTSQGNTKQEYAPTREAVEKNLGSTTQRTKTGVPISQEKNEWVDPNDEFGGYDINQNLVWGKNGIAPVANDNINQLRGTSNNADQQVFSKYDLPNADFDVKVGLLEYTRNLLNANNGNIIDQTRKVFLKDNKYVSGFNGSALWVANDSKYIGDKAGITGLRQHNVLDKYDRFAKAIRFNGNQVYNGNENSVVYKSVLPKMHPIINGETGTIDNKNMMFSLENLAVKVISNDKYGIIDDEYGSPIPLCEVGPFAGRIMWFPPYNLEFNETASAKYESTVMIGRNEPMYNYQNSERSAQLSFTLLVDYPPHVRNYKDQRSIAEFFAFGGNDYVDKFVPDDGVTPRIPVLEAKIETITGPENLTYTPETLNPRTAKIVFPNDEPKVGQESGYIDRLYKDCAYEIKEGLPSSDGTSWGLNKDVFFVSGVSGNTIDGYILVPLNFSQYTVDLPADQYGNTPLLDKLLKYVYNDEGNRELYDVQISGAASKLYQHPELEPTYNKALGQRRADVAADLVEERLVVLFGAGADQLGITVNTISVGSTQANVENATPEAIPEEDTKEERYAEIKIVKNDKPVKAKTRDLTTEQKKEVEDLQKEIDGLKTKARQAKDMKSCIMTERGGSGANESKDTGILGGFKSITGNYYYPVFHTQTPEDFHKRLTFLNQCTRQGAAKRWNNPNNNNSNDSDLRARNSVFGRQPICILRIGDFFYTKVIIENVTIDYTDTTWDMNPEGFGMQPMLAKVTLQMKLIGGQSLKGPIDALQNAVSFNYYANSTYTNQGLYKLPSDQADKQEAYNKGVAAEELNKKVQIAISAALAAVRGGV